MMMFGIFGVRRTLSKVVEKVGDTVDSTELVGAIIEGVADGLASPRMVGNLLISSDSLGQWIFRVAQNDRHRQVTLSEIRRKTAILSRMGGWI
jgi:hypothetical protein